MCVCVACLVARLGRLLFACYSRCKKNGGTTKYGPHGYSEQLTVAAAAAAALSLAHNATAYERARARGRFPLVIYCN